MIPRVIHYCWFGKNDLSKQAVKCIDSWKKYCKEYEIIEWNESNFDIHCNRYVEEAYSQKKWAFVSDYARLYIIYNQGGFYFDTDVELLKSIDDLRMSKAFFAQEVSGMVATGLGFGAEKGNPVVRLMMDEYADARFLLKNGVFDLTPCPLRNTMALIPLGFKRNGQTQEILKADVYSADYFCPYDYVQDRMNITDNTYSIHHYEASWDYSSEVKEKYRIFYRFLGHHIGHFLCETGEKLKEVGPVKTIGFIKYRVKYKIKKVWLSNARNGYRKRRGTD